MWIYVALLYIIRAKQKIISYFFIQRLEMENIRNKANNIYPKDYFDRFTMLSVYSFTKPNDKKNIHRTKTWWSLLFVQQKYFFNQERNQL